MTSRERAEKLLNSKAWADVALLDPESDEALLPLIAAAIDEAVAEAFEEAAKFIESRADLLDEHAQIAGQPNLSSGAFIRPFAVAIRARKEKP